MTDYQGDFDSVWDTLRELSDRIEYLTSLNEALLNKRKVDGLNGRVWDAMEHWKQEEKIRKILGEQSIDKGTPYCCGYDNIEF